MWRRSGLQKIKLYAEVSAASRRVLRAAQQRRHLVFEIFKSALLWTRTLRTRTWGRRLAARRAGRRRLGRDRRRDRIAGRAAKCSFQPLRHLGEIGVGAGGRG